MAETKAAGISGSTSAASSPTLTAPDVQRMIDARVGVLAGQIAHDAVGGVHDVAVTGELHTIPEKEPFWHKAETWTAGGTLVLSLVTFALARYTKQLAKATFSVVESDEKASQAELRAYFGVVGANVDQSDPNKIAVTLVMQNFGRTPAHNVRIFFQTEVTRAGDPSLIAVPEHLESRGSAPPTQRLEATSDVSTPRDLLIPAMRDGTAVLRAIGIARYLDIYGGEHETPIYICGVLSHLGVISMQTQPQQGPMT